MAERTFQFGEKKFSNILKVAGDWISWVTNQQTSLILPPPPPFFSLSTKQSICHHSQYATKAVMNLITRSSQAKKGEKKSKFLLS